MKTLLIVGAGAVLLTACQPNKSYEGESPNSKVVQQEANALEETSYRAVLTPVGSSTDGGVSGTVVINISTDTFNAQVDLMNGAPDTTYRQSIRTASSCPTEEADTNDDGFIDGAEGYAVYGNMIVPLDGDLSSQTSGMEGFPTTDQTGSYVYREQAPLPAMITDLTGEDTDTTDDIEKIDSDTLDLTNKVVVIEGVPESTELPDSVMGRGQASPASTIPIACGVLMKERSDSTNGDSQNGDEDGQEPDQDQDQDQHQQQHPRPRPHQQQQQQQQNQRTQMGYMSVE